MYDSENNKFRLKHDSINPDVLLGAHPLMLLNPVTNFLSHTGAAREFVFSRPAAGVLTLSIVKSIPQRVFSGITPRSQAAMSGWETGWPLAELFLRDFWAGPYPSNMYPKTGHCSLSPFCRCGDYILEGRLEPGACFQTPLDPLLNPRRRARIWLPSPSSRLSVWRYIYGRFRNYLLPAVE